MSSHRCNAHPLSKTLSAVKSKTMKCETEMLKVSKALSVVFAAASNDLPQKSESIFEYHHSPTGR